MSKPRMSSKRSRKSEVDALFFRADKEWNRGKLRSAFRLFLLAAKGGDKASQVNVGNFYSDGTGIRRNIPKALYWYRRAYRRGDASAANNIGIVWRDAGNQQRALSWFLRAVKLGNDGSNLEIAKYYLRNANDPTSAISYLEKVCQSDHASEGEVEKAKRALKQANRKLTHG